MDNIRNKFKEKLESTFINGSLSNEEKDSMLWELLSVFPDENLPSLFRYRSCNDDSISAFEEDKIFLVIPELFNDPYDCLPFINKSYIIDNLSFAVDKNRLKNYIQNIKREDKIIAVSLFKNILSEEEYRNFIKNFDMSEAEIEKFVLKNGRNLSEKINELDIAINNLIEEFKELHYISCFSERNDSILMWSHYANKHEGFVLKYDWESLVSQGGVILAPVLYDNSRMNITDFVIYNLFSRYLQNPDELALVKSQLYKSKDWEYEKEWRMICRRNSKKQSKSKSIKRTPKAIYYGEKISEENRNKLHKIAQQKGIDEYQAQIDLFSPNYKMSFKKL